MNPECKSGTYENLHSYYDVLKSVVFLAADFSSLKLKVSVKITAIFKNFSDFDFGIGSVLANGITFFDTLMITC